MTPLPPPPGWGEDTLSEFMETAHRNRFATFDNKKDWFERLSRLDACFARVAKDWRDPDNLIAPLLFLRSHAAYRAACEHALAGQISETFPMLRVCLEHVGYALHIQTNNGFDEIWLRRHDDADALKEMKAKFQIAGIRNTIEEANPTAAGVFEALYERAIEFGAHPNERSVTGSLTIVELEGGKEFQQAYLHGDGLQLDHVLKSTAQTGVCALDVSQEAFAARFEALGIRTEVARLRKGL